MNFYTFFISVYDKKKNKDLISGLLHKMYIRVYLL